MGDIRDAAGEATAVIRPYRAADLEALVALSLRAWAPVFASLEAELEPAVYQAFYPDGWEASQARSVRDTCTADAERTWVAESDGRVVGFAVLRLHAEDKLGEIYMIAVEPSYQGRGLGTRLTEFAINKLREAGMSIAMVETGGDAGHAPARRTYERAGFRVLPLARFFRKL